MYIHLPFYLIIKLIIEYIYRSESALTKGEEAAGDLEDIFCKLFQVHFFLKLIFGTQFFFFFFLAPPSWNVFPCYTVAHAGIEIIPCKRIRIRTRDSTVLGSFLWGFRFYRHRNPPSVLTGRLVRSIAYIKWSINYSWTELGARQFFSIMTTLTRQRIGVLWHEWKFFRPHG